MKNRWLQKRDGPTFNLIHYIRHRYASGHIREAKEIEKRWGTSDLMKNARFSRATTAVMLEGQRFNEHATLSELEFLKKVDEGNSFK